MPPAYLPPHRTSRNRLSACCPMHAVRYRLNRPALPCPCASIPAVSSRPGHSLPPVRSTQACIPFPSYHHPLLTIPPPGRRGAPRHRPQGHPRATFIPSRQPLVSCDPAAATVLLTAHQASAPASPATIAFTRCPPPPSCQAVTMHVTRKFHFPALPRRPANRLWTWAPRPRSAAR